MNWLIPWVGAVIMVVMLFNHLRVGRGPSGDSGGDIRGGWSHDHDGGHGHGGDGTEAVLLTPAGMAVLVTPAGMAVLVTEVVLAESDRRPPRPK